MIVSESTKQERGLTHQREACFSEDGKYRYRLSIIWEPTKRALPMIGLNPSIATAEHNDPTMRREIDFAISLGFGGLHKFNAFALVSTDYKALFKTPDPIGPENTIEFLQHWCDGPMVIACWGAHITERPWRHFYRGYDLAKAIPNLHALRVTKSHHPEHTLYLPSSLKPEPFAYAD